jgi:hypothetical protein
MLAIFINVYVKIIYEVIAIVITVKNVINDFTESIQFLEAYLYNSKYFDIPLFSCQMTIELLIISSNYQ